MKQSYVVVMGTSTLLISLAATLPSIGVTTAEVCTTDECKTAASQIHALMNHSAKPCDNFYEFACGSWSSTNRRPEPEDMLPKLIALLTNNVDFEDISAVKKAKDYYKSCVNLDLIEQTGINATFAMLEKLGGWPVLGDKPGGNWDESKFDLTNMMTTLSTHGFMKSMIHLEPDFGNRNKSEPKLRLTFPIMRHYQPDGYRNFSFRVAQMFGASKEQAEKEMGRAMELRTSLINMYNTNYQYGDNYVTVSNLDTVLQIPAQNNDLLFSMTNYVKGVMAGLEIDFADTGMVNVQCTAYYKNVFDVLSKFTKRDIANHLVFSFIFESVPYLPKSFIDEARRYIQNYYETRHSDRRCVLDMNRHFREPIEYMCVSKFINVAIIPEVERMFRGIMSAFKGKLETLSWMDESTRIAAAKKADAVVQFIGYNPNSLNTTWLNKKYENVNMNAERFLDNQIEYKRLEEISKFIRVFTNTKVRWTVDEPYTQAMMFDQDTNTMAVSASSLQRPIYDPDRLKLINFGWMGMKYASQLSEAFSKYTGRLYDGTGVVKVWWTDGTYKNYNAKVDCLRKQYASFLNNIGITPVPVYFDYYLDMDNFGTKYSYTAYQDWVAAQGSEEAVLDLRYNNQLLNKAQLFFLVSTQAFCGSLRRDILKIKYYHIPPDDFRANNVLQNMPEFAQAFGCKEGDRMNPSDKCIIW